jgi:hypothetical protein
MGTVRHVSSEDPERLLSEALRAQAIRTPGTPAPAADKSPVVYGLLSGTDLNVPQAAPQETPEETHRLVEAPKQVSAWLVLALALFLGLAAGAVVGLLTLV